jgi:2-methylcitrate dehydratase PrpD
VALRVGTVRHTEVDDIHTSSNVTPSSVIVPTALTMAERLGVTDPQTVAAALIAGYEAITRLGLAIDGPVILYKGVWITYYAAPFGAAAVTSRLLSLAPDKTAQALAIALTQCTGRAGPAGPGRPARWLVVGEAARAGVAAALAARAGFTASLELLDGNWFTNAFGEHARPDELLAGLGETSVVGDLSMKPCCTGKQAISAIAAFMDLLNEGLDAESVEKVEVFVPERYRAMVDRGVTVRPGPSFGHVRYQFALAAFNPSLLYDAARTDPITDPRIATLMEKVTIAADESLAEHLPRCWPARVEVTTPSGKLEKTVVAAPGDPDRRLDEAATLAKFHAVADRLVGAETAGEWTAAAGNALTDAAALKQLTEKFDRLFA